MEVKEVIAELHRAWDEFKREVEAQRGASEEKLNRINERLDSLELELRRPRVSVEQRPLSISKWLRSGELDEHTKALYSSDGSAGGYLLAPPQYEEELNRSVTELSPIRQIAKVVQITTGEFTVRRRTATFSAQWVSELGSRAETTGLTFGMETIRAHELYARVDVSRQLLEDAAFDIERELTTEFTEQFAVAEGAAFVNGNGSGKPEGFLVNTSVTKIPSGANGDFSADSLIKLLTALKDGYWRNATFVLNRETLRKVRTLKDTTNRYIWVPPTGDLSGGMAATILDRPYVLCPDMPSTGTTGALSVAVGDFRRGYYIVDRVGLQIQRDPYSGAANGTVVFWARKRVGGQVVDPRAIVILKESTS